MTLDLILDSKDRMIISLLEQKPDLTQAEVAKTTQLSQSAIASRLKKLGQSGIFVRGAGLNFELLGLQMGRVDVDAEMHSSVLKWASRCPLFINASVGIGGKNLSLFFVSEDLQMFHWIVDEHLRRIKDISEISFSQIVQWIKNFPIYLDLNYPKLENPPCGMLPFCPKCPGYPGYSGKIWQKKSVKENKNG